jgi:hypothetical protein
MDMFYIPALASFSGSASGTLASIVTGLVTQRRKDRVRHTLRATSQREELYKNFIEEASRLYADALVNDQSEVSKLVDLYALIARMKILSSDAVIEAAEKAGRLILDIYLSPNRTFSRVYLHCCPYARVRDIRIKKNHARRCRDLSPIGQRVLIQARPQWRPALTSSGAVPLVTRAPRRLS